MDGHQGDFAHDRHSAFSAWSRSVSEHPENVLDTDADSANLRYPEPHTLEDLMSMPDPVAQAEANRRSSRQALAYLVAVPALTLIVAGLLAGVSRVIGGPLCDAGQAAWLCTPASHIWWPLATAVVPLIGLVACGFILNYKLQHYTRWRPWMGVFWVMVPWFMAWVIFTGQMLIIEVSTP